jgi:hypothetical protein
MGAWVEAGIAGAIFWLWVLILTARAMIGVYSAKVELVVLITFFAFTLLWNIPFSPFGGEGRLYTAYYISLMMFALTLSSSFNPEKMEG